MEQYIPKSALMAEIEKLENKNYKNSNDFNLGVSTYLGLLKHFVNTLEVKEVDFDAEWERYFEHRGEMATVNVKHLAKCFFELGIKVVQKGE